MAVEEGGRERENFITFIYQAYAHLEDKDLDILKSYQHNSQTYYP